MSVGHRLQDLHRRLAHDRTTLVLGVAYWLAGLWLLAEPEFITRCEGDTCWYYSVLTYDIGLFLAGMVATTLASAALAPVSVVAGQTAETGIEWFGQQLDRQAVSIASAITGLLAVTLLVVEPFGQCTLTQYGPSGCESLRLWDIHPVVYAGAVVISGAISLVGTVLVREVSRRVRQ